MNDPQLSEALLKEFLGNNYATEEEVAEVVAEVISKIKESKDLTDAEIQDIKDTVSKHFSKIEKRIDDLRDAAAKDRKSTEQEIKNIKLKPGPKGDKGDKGDTIKGDKGDPGYTPVKGVDYFDGKDAVFDETRLADVERIARLAAERGAMPITTTNFFKDGALIGRAKNINIIEGPNTDLSVSIVGDQANIIISATSGGGVNIDTQTVTATDAGGNNVDIDLTQLNNAWTSIQVVWRNGSAQDRSKWSIVGDNLTLTGAVSTNSYQIQYTY